MDHTTDERDEKLLDGDRYAFFVLRRVMGGACDLLLTDHERLIICLSQPPHPVWIWTPDDAGAAEWERAYRVTRAHGLLDGTHRFNLKPEAADYFIKRAAEEGSSLSVITRMIAYDCPKPVRPDVPADGGMRHFVRGEAAELAAFIAGLAGETGVDEQEMPVYLRDAEAAIEEGRVFCWEDAAGNKTASCKYVPNGDLASVNLVYTIPAYRRRHYAENLVYAVTELARGAGYLPMLYADGDYPPSNACYRKIGYVPRGTLYTIG